MGETRVDLQHLLEDIRDAYPGSLEETIVTEIVANSLDSGATHLRFETDPARATLTVIDDGSGMARRELARYHDIAASTKSRGEGIGFAGVGIKLGILASAEVFTETRRGKSHVASTWHLASRNKAPWRWTPPLGLVASHGTAVRLTLRNPLSPLLESGFLEEALSRHFQPLLDPAFDALLADHYARPVTLEVNGRPMVRSPGPPERVLLGVRVGRKRKPSAVGWLLRSAVPLPDEQQGVAVSTLGKVIRRGWDWLGISPPDADRVGGLFEVPGLAECLTLNKADFIRTGPRGATYLTFRKTVQEAVAAQLAAWGAAPPAADEEARRRKTRPVEKDLTGVLMEMADDFPLIASLVEQRSGGQKRLPMGRAGARAGDAVAAGAAHLDGVLREGGSDGAQQGAARKGPESSNAPPAPPPGEAGAPSSGTEGLAGEGAQESPPPEGSTSSGPQRAGAGIDWPAKGGRRRPLRMGLTIQFESRPEDAQLGRLVESTVWVNDAHPAYRRAVAARAEGYHLALCVALALAPLAVEPASTHGFVTTFLARWGEAVERPAGGRGRGKGAAGGTRRRGRAAR